MQGTTAGIRDGTEELTGLEARRPELAAWLRPLAAALAALHTEPWRSLAPLPAPVRDARAPLLHEAILPVDSAAARILVAAVLGAAFGASARAGAVGGIDPL